MFNHLLNKQQKKGKRWTVSLILLLGVWSLLSWAQPATPSNQASIQRALQKAHDLFYDQRYQAALDAYLKIFNSEASTSSAITPNIQLNIGRCYAELGQDKQALQNFSTIINGDPNDSYATQAVYQVGNLFVQRYQYDQASRVCQQILDKHPQAKSGAIAGYLAGQYWYYAGQTEKSIQAYQAFLGDYPASPYRSSALRSLVQIWIKAQQFEPAERLLKDQLSQKSQDPDLVEQLADLYKAQGKLDLAFQLYRSALDKAPDDTDLLKKLGELYAESGNRQQALALWAKIATSNPNQYYRYQQMADVYVANQLYDQAIVAYQSALKLNSTNAYLYTELAGVYKIKGEIPQVVDTLLKALSVVDFNFNNRDMILQELSNIYEGERQRQLLTEVLTKLEALNQNSPKRLLTLAEISFHAQDFDRALRYFRQFGQQYPQHKGPMLEKYTHILDRNGHSQANQFYQALIADSPNSQSKRNSQVKLVKRYQRTGDWEQALATLQQIEAKDISIQLKIADLLLHSAYRFSEAEQIYRDLSQRSLSVQYQQQVNLGLAETLLLSNRFVAARSILQPISERKGTADQAQALKLIGDAYLFGRNFESAIQTYKQVAQLLTEYTNEALAWMVRIQSNSDRGKEPLVRYVEAEYLKRKGLITEAAHHCRSAIQQYPQSLIVEDLRWMLGDLYLHQKQFTTAIQQYRQVISQGNGTLSAEAQAQIADIYQFEIKDREQAYQSYAALIELYGDSVVSAYAQQQADALR